MVNFVQKPWPSADLEVVLQCPVCGETKRSVLHGGLVDRVFCVADGVWTLYQCAACKSAYLDPRPTPASLGRAYTGYYTHDGEDHPIVRRKGRLRSLLHDLINGYQNSRYQVRREPALRVGRWLLPLLPSLRSAADAECRHLPALPAGGGRLLDVGCGNGGFLVLARQAGWQVEGVDFDAGAVQVARSRGLEVHHGGIEVLTKRETGFDVITICHVIEHVYDPVAILRQLHALLKPGGTLWLDTPNLGSLGARRFGPNWRDLDPPRHLVLFNPASLRRALTEAGFQSLRQHWRGLSLFDVYAPSEAMARGGTAMGASHQGRPPLGDLAAELWEMLRPTRREFLTLSARK
jgi:2-polyprenyl-3-methyl-5-hydroxy-6-metoxy-1,4-benzoquinol methylase